MSSDPWQWECPQIPGSGNALTSLAVGMPSRPWQWECPQIPGSGNVLRSLAVGMSSDPWQWECPHVLGSGDVSPIASRGSVDKKRHRGKRSHRHATISTSESRDRRLSSQFSYKSEACARRQEEAEQVGYYITNTNKCITITNKLVSNWILTSCQPHRVTSGQRHSRLHLSASLYRRDDHSLFPFRGFGAFLEHSPQDGKGVAVM